MPVSIDLHAYKSSLGISIPEALRQPFFDALARLEERAGFKGKSAVMLDLVVKAADRLDDIVHAAVQAPVRERISSLGRGTEPSSQSVPQVAPIQEPQDIPALFRALFYEQLHREPADCQRTIAAIMQAIDRFVPQEAAQFSLQALNRQLVGVLLRDSGNLDAALDTLDQAVAEAHALEELLPEEAINLLAAAHYRRASIFFHQHKRLPCTERVARRGILGEARWALEAALEAAQHPACRPCVKGVIVMRYAAFLAMPEIHAVPPFEQIEHSLQEALTLAEQQQAANQDGYDPVGFLHHPSGVHHTWAQVTLSLFRPDVSDVPESLSLANGEDHIMQALDQMPSACRRWWYDCKVTRLKLLHAQVTTKLDGAIAEAADLRQEAGNHMSDRLHLDFDTTLVTLQDAIHEQLRQFIPPEKA
jgi:tetratricopeptide (TPR) repeat protein